MKKITLICIALFFTVFVYGQSIIGKWQAESAKLTSMNFDSYTFSSDGKFVFEPNSYNGLNRVLNISGKYRIKGNKLFLTPEYTKELVGGFPVRSESTTLSDTWEIVQGKIKNIPCKKTEQPVSIKIKSNTKIILLDDRKFYKISK